MKEIFKKFKEIQKNLDKVKCDKFKKKSLNFEKL